MRISFKSKGCEGMLGVGQQGLCDQVVLSMVYIFWKQSSSMMQKFGSWQTHEGTHAAVNSHSYQNRFIYLQQKNWIVFFPECLTKGKCINDVCANTMDILSIPIYSINNTWCVNLFFSGNVFSSPVLVGKSRTLMLGNKAKYCWLDVCNSKLWGIGSNSLAACGKWWVPHRETNWIKGVRFPEIPCVLGEQSHETCIFPDIKTFSVIWIKIFLSFAFLWKVASPSQHLNIRHSRNIYIYYI